jgi:carbon-monoxide dehydrogenase large subunit
MGRVEERYSGRVEDERLVTGRGRYSDDARAPDQAYAAFLRAPMAHGEIRSIDVEAARESPGVLAVLTGADLEGLGYGRAFVVPGLKHADGRPAFVPDWPPLATGRVRFVGEPVALVVADSAAAAHDAAELIDVTFAELPAVVHTRYEPRPETAIWPEAPDNVSLDFRAGDSEAVARAFAGAAHVVDAQIVSQRLVVTPMEPRSALASYDPAENRFELQAGSQGAAALAAQLALALNVPIDRMKVLTRDVGGGFGAKSHLYPDYVALLEASRRLGRPVKWTSSRSEAFQSDTQGRDTVLRGEIALDAEGRFLAVRVASDVNTGAYQSSHSVFTATNNLFRCLAGVYATPAIEVAIRCLYSNTVPVAPYRGAGRPEAVLIMERLVDRAAGTLGIDPAELRRRNLVPADAMPYGAPNGMTYDSGDFARCLARALDLSDYAGFPARREAARQAGLLRGIGIACYLEIAGGSPFEDMRLDVGPDGIVTLNSGLQSNGQGHATVFPKLTAERLGIPAAQVTLGEGDSTLVPEGAGSVGSRSMTVGGAAIIKATAALVERAREAAAALMQVTPDEVTYAEGRVTRAATGQSLTLGEIVSQGRALGVLERGRADLTFPNGCHVAEIEIEPATGIARFAAFTAVDDVGVCINPTFVEGQVRGGIAQGLGQVLLERAVFEETSGQLVTGSFMDYPIPRADDLPVSTVEHVEVPCTTNPLGTKGAGEAGTTGALAAGYNALLDALRPAGVLSFDMPATPARVWQALN